MIFVVSSSTLAHLEVCLALTSVRNEPFSLFHFNVLLCPLDGSGDILFFPLRLSVCLSVSKPCLLYNLITVKDISMTFHTFVKHIQTTCHAQES